MTAIIGYTDSKTVWLAADSAYSYTDSDDIAYTGINNNPKIYKQAVYINGDCTELVIGFSGDLRFSQTLIYQTRLPEHNSGHQRDTELEFIINDIVPRFITTGDETGCKGSAVIGVNGRIFELDDSYTVVEPADGLATTGSAQEVCKAAFHACLTLKPDLNIENALLIALNTANKIMPESIQPPYKIETVNYQIEHTI